MSVTNSISAYRDCQELFDKAIEGSETGKGVRAKFGTYAECVSLRQRLHHFRSLHRELMAQVYEEGHQLHGQSVYDDFIVQIFDDETGDGAWIYISKRTSKILALEIIDEGTEAIDVPSHEIQLIEDKTNG